MQFSVRRIVTGHDINGRSQVMSDTRVVEERVGGVDLWLTSPDGPDSGHDIPFFPAPGTAILKIVRLPAPTPGMTREQLDAQAEAFFQMAGDACRIDTTRDPLMHVTPTTDFLMLISGEISLILDEGEPVALKPGDTVVQRATNHAWRVTGNEPAVLVCVMLGTEGRLLRPDA